MHDRLKRAVVLMLFFSMTVSSKEKDSSSMLIDAPNLKKILNQKNVRILDTRSAADYAKGHVPRALHVDVSEWKTLAFSPRGFYNAKAWQQKLSRLGINRASQVIVYCYAPTSTARIWWLLKYLGFENASILDGGWAWWIKSKGAITRAVLRVKPTDIEVRFQSDRLMEIGELKKQLKSDKLKLIDTRSTGEHTGKVKRGPRGGHIPGSTHLEWKELLADDGRYKSKAQLRALFKKKGIQPDDSAVCY